jgi:hypothetical protein
MTRESRRTSRPGDAYRGVRALQERRRASEESRRNQSAATTFRRRSRRCQTRGWATAGVLPPGFAYRYHREPCHRHRDERPGQAGREREVEPVRADIKEEPDHFVPQIERGALHWQGQMRTNRGH